MDGEELARKQEILEALKSRLHEREVQAAHYGVSADPVIPNEIKRFKAKIRKVEREIKELEASPSNLVAASKATALPSGDHTQASHDSQQARAAVTPEQRYSNTRSSSIPDEILAVIRAQAERDFPANLSTRKYQIDTETDAWRKLQTFKADDVTGDVVQTIMNRAAQDFPHKFSTQLYQVNNQVQAWRELQTFSVPDVPAEVLNTILTKAASDFRDNFSTQMYVINTEVKAWRDLYQ
jgi:hypothetical protein